MNETLIKEMARKLVQNPPDPENPGVIEAKRYVMFDDAVAALSEAYEAGEIAMREKALKAVADEMPCDCGFDENPVRYKYSSESGHAMNCNQYAALDAIRALPLSGAEESKK